MFSENQLLWIVPSPPLSSKSLQHGAGEEMLTACLPWREILALAWKLGVQGPHWSWAAAGRISASNMMSWGLDKGAFHCSYWGLVDFFKKVFPICWILSEFPETLNGCVLLIPRWISSILNEPPFLYWSSLNLSSSLYSYLPPVCHGGMGQESPWLVPASLILVPIWFPFLLSSLGCVSFTSILLAAAAHVLSKVASAMLQKAPTGHDKPVGEGVM